MPGGGGGDGPHVSGQVGGPLGAGAVEVLAADHGVRSARSAGLSLSRYRDNDNCPDVAGYAGSGPGWVVSAGWGGGLAAWFGIITGSRGMRAVRPWLCTGLGGCRAGQCGQVPSA